jgi:hypothetical protein
MEGCCLREYLIFSPDKELKVATRKRERWNKTIKEALARNWDKVSWKAKMKKGQTVRGP